MFLVAKSVFLLAFAAEPHLPVRRNFSDRLVVELIQPLLDCPVSIIPEVNTRIDRSGLIQKMAAADPACGRDDPMESANPAL